MTTQTNQELSPTINLSETINDEVTPAESRNILLIGHILDTTTLKEGFEVYEPVDIGQITSTLDAVAFLRKHSFSLVFKDNNNLDMDKSDEIAIMLYSAAKEYENFIATEPVYALAPCRFFLGVLYADSTKTEKPYTSKDGTKDLLEAVEQSKTPVDAYVCCYEYEKGDFSPEENSDNYYTILKNHATTILDLGNPTLGEQWCWFANISNPNTATADLDNTNFVKSSLYTYYLEGGGVINSVTYYTAAALNSAASVHMVGCQAPYQPRANVRLYTVPVNTKYSCIYTRAQEEDALQRGWSVILSNFSTKTVYFSRVLSASLQDPVTSLARTYMLDYADFKVSHLSLYNWYEIIESAGFLNKRNIVGKDGKSDLLEKIVDAAIGVDLTLYNEGMIALNPEKYADKYKATVDLKNPNRINLQKPIYVASAIEQIYGVQVSLNPVNIYTTSNVAAV